MSAILHRLFCTSLLLFCFKLFAAQSVLPFEEWKTLETANFKVHYTNAYREWAISAAHEMEASVEVIKKSQNRALTEKVDVVVFDPLNDSNGFALPFSTKPIMALYATPPLSHSIIANSSSWQQLLALHEYVHLVHLAQPSRDGLTQALSQFWDIYDIALREDRERWVAEGYATLQESRLTGRGRLYDAQVEAMIRQYAKEGALPKYSQLNKTEGGYRIGSMAYLVGVRFLYWLEDNYSQDTLDGVWTRLQAKRSRSFEEAFKGVFGEPPEYLYQRFIAEYTYEVMAQEKSIGRSTSTLWYDAKYDLDSPVISPKQEYIAFVETNSKRDSQIKVLPLQSDGKAKQKFEESNQELLADDPKDIPNILPKVFNNSAKYTLHERNFAGMSNLRWLDKNHILFTAKTRGSDGRLHQDLFSWQLASGKVQQLTEGANLRRFDVNLEAGFLIAEHTRYGKSGLMRFDIENGQLTKLGDGTLITPFSMKAVHDFPRISPNGNDLAYLRTQPNEPWSLLIKPLDAADSDINVSMPVEYQFLSYPQWSHDGSYLYFVAGSQDKVQLYRYQLDDKSLVALSHGQEMVAWPIELKQVKLEADSEPQDWLMHVSIQSRGPDLFVQSYDELKQQPVTQFTKPGEFDYLMDNTDSAVLMPKAVINTDVSIGQERKYDVWDQDLTATLTGTEASASYGSSEIGIKGGDLLQRLNWQVSAMQGTHDIDSGYSGSVAWHGWPIKLTAHVFNLELADSVSQLPLPEDAAKQDTNLFGFYLSGSKSYAISSSTYTGELSASYSESKSDWLDSEAFSLSHKQKWGIDRVKWGVAQQSLVTLHSGESQSPQLKDSWSGFDAELGLSAHAFGFKLAANFQRAERSGTDIPLLTFGGIESASFVAKAHVNTIFAPEFALGSAVGNEYSNTRWSLSGRRSGFELYYAQPEVDGVKVADVIGLAGRGGIDMFGSGLTNIVLNYGIAEVRTTAGDDEVEVWLSWFYQL